MNVLVCLKQILDPDIPARDFRINREKMQAERGAADLVPNIFCENAIETALQLRDETGGKITVVTYGTEESEEALRKALAMRADEAVLIVNEGAANPDPLCVAKVLAAAARKLGELDLVLVGRESGDWGVGQTGGLLAEELRWPFVALVDQVRRAPAPETGFQLRLRRQTDAGFEIIEAIPPLVASVSNSDGNLPRIPKTRDVMLSYRKPLARWTAQELGLASEPAMSGREYYQLIDLTIPEKKVRCEFAVGDSLEERVDDFARRIKAVIDSA